MSYNETYVNDAVWRKRQEEVKKDEAFVNRMQSKIKDIDAYIAKKKNDYFKICSDNEKKMDRAMLTLSNSYGKAIDSVKNSGIAAVAGTKKNFETQINDIRSDIKNAGASIKIADMQINKIADDFNAAIKSMAATKHSEADKAIFYSNQLKDILDQISNLYPDVHKPLEYNSLISKNNNLNADINSGAYAAGIALAQTSVLEASKLLTQLIVLNEQANTMLQEIYMECSDIKKKMMRLASDDAVLSIDIDGEREEYEYNIRRWSERLGDGLSFDSIENKFNQQEKILSEKCTIDQLKIVKKNIDIINKNLTVCDNESREFMMGAVAAASAAESMVSSLNAAGWDITMVENDDERNPITMKGSDGAGNEVAVIISPGEENPSISWYVDDDDLVQKEMKEEALRNELCGCGIDIVHIQKDEKHCARINKVDDFVNLMVE